MSEIEIDPNEYQAFLIDRRHLDYQECAVNEAKLIDYLSQHDAPITANTLALAYADLKAKGELIIAPRPEPIPAPAEAPPQRTTQPLATPPRVAKVWRNGRLMDLTPVRPL